VLNPSLENVNEYVVSHKCVSSNFPCSSDWVFASATEEVIVANGTIAFSDASVIVPRRR